MMYQSFPYDQYNSYYYATMSKSPDECNSPEFRSRSQTWGGNELGYGARVQQISPPEQYTCCFDSLNSIDDSHDSVEDVTEKVDQTSETIPKGSNVKKTSRKNAWGQETYADLIECAINSYPSKMATLQQIYDHISKNYKYFMDRSDATSSAGWKNSIRHNLSLHDKFIKCPKKNENMKSSLWSINLNSIKRARSNSMGGKNNGLESVAKRRQAKEYKRHSASNSNSISEPKGLTSLRSPNIEKNSKSDKYRLPKLSNEEDEEEVVVTKCPEFLEMETDLKYLPPNISNNIMASQRDYCLHEDLGRLGMNPMEPIYDDNDNCQNCESSVTPNFHMAAMEYSRFVAELFND